MPNFRNVKSSFVPAPAGTHVARCYSCIALGTQKSDIYADSFKIMLQFELPNEPMEQPDGSSAPMVVSKEFTFSKGKKSNLRKMLESWRGKPFTDEQLENFEVSDVVGAPCMLTIVHQTAAGGGTYAKIEAITGVPKGLTCPPQFHKSIKYEIEQGMDDTYKNLPDWIRKKIDNCEEWIHPAAAQPAATTNSDPGEPDPQAGDDVPF